jgi:hypothetical protein
MPILRYQGKPLLRLLECYVLWAIDHLSETEANSLREMTPKLQSLYRVEGDWQQVIASVMQLPPNVPALIKNLWIKNTEIARQNGVTLSPQQFAEMFVDQNLAS